MSGWNIFAIVLALITIGMNVWVRIEQHKREKRIEKANREYELRYPDEKE